MTRPTPALPAAVRTFRPHRSRDLPVLCALLIVPGAVARGETPARRSPLHAQLPHPDWGSRILRDNSFILVITGVEPGDRGPFRRSARSRHVGALWAAGARPVSTRGHLDGCAPGTTVVHVLSPASPCAVPSPSA